MIALRAQESLSAAPYSTYRIGGPIDRAYFPCSMNEAVDLLKGLDAVTVLGWGSNSLIASRGIRGDVLITRKMDWVESVSSTGLIFGAGVHLAKSAAAAQKVSLHGAEYMIGIPGTMGGAVRMNAGALGQETAQVVQRVWVFERESKTVQVWSANECQFQYRHSALEPNKHIVLQVECEFAPGNLAEITQMMEGSIAFRKAHHPTEPNGGSVFKNPKPETAGALLDEMGAKSWTEGGVRVSPMHANFIVNTGEGTSTDVLRLMVRMKASVFERHGLTLQPENILMGDITEEEARLWSYLQRRDLSGIDVSEVPEFLRGLF
ncbi:MAG: UDP-N-acetylmuramate dehydrogenase [Cyanobacteria bacterium]|nr:UDP-N-acetylmuramate dehydrogenase [Cyanobacteriota bacterium]